MFTYFKKSMQGSGDVPENNEFVSTKKENNLNKKKMQSQGDIGFFKLPSDIIAQLVSQTEDKGEKRQKVVKKRQNFVDDRQKKADRRQQNLRESQIETKYLKQEDKKDVTISNKESRNGLQDMMTRSEGRVECKEKEKQMEVRQQECNIKGSLKQQMGGVRSEEVVRVDKINKQGLQDKRSNKQGLWAISKQKVSSDKSNGDELGEGVGRKIGDLSQSELQQLVSSIVEGLLSVTQQQLTQQPIPIKQLSTVLSAKTVSTIQKLNSSYWQSYILQTKQRYNQLVDQSTNLFSKSRQIADYINQFLLSINLFFQTQELLIPAQQIQKAIAQLNPPKTEKYINYLIKIFQNNFDQCIENKINKIKSTLQSELRNSQKQIKQLQIEINKLKQSYKLKQNIFNENNSKFQEKQTQIINLKKEINLLKTQINQINSQSQQNNQDRNSQNLLLKRQLQRSKRQLQESCEKITKLQRVIQAKDKTIGQKQQEVQKLSQVIKQVKQVENEGMQDIVQQMELKEKMFQGKIQRFNNDRINLYHKIRTITTEKEIETQNYQELNKQTQQLKQLVHTLKQQLAKHKQAQQLNANQKEHRQHQINNETDQQTHNKRRQHEEDSQRVDFSKLINKEIMGHLFSSFDDESKDWATKNNIRNQIKILLDLNQKTQTQTKIQINKSHKLQNNSQSEANVNNKQPNQKLNEGTLIGKWLGW